MYFILGTEGINFFLFVDFLFLPQCLVLCYLSLSLFQESLWTEAEKEIANSLRLDRCLTIFKYCDSLLVGENGEDNEGIS